MAIPARCNRRSCQARRNLSKPPEQYARWPRCRVAGCGGQMYVDRYRLRKGAKDRAPVCCDPYCPWTPPDPRKWGGWSAHRVDTAGCSGYEGYRLERSLVASKHRPVRAEESEEAPF